jgi:hypothetical protein
VVLFFVLVVSTILSLPTVATLSMRLQPFGLPADRLHELYQQDYLPRCQFVFVVQAQGRKHHQDGFYELDLPSILILNIT